MTQANPHRNRIWNRDEELFIIFLVQLLVMMSYIANGQQPLVEEQQDAQDEEGHSKTS